MERTPTAAVCGMGAKLEDAVAPEDVLGAAPDVVEGMMRVIQRKEGESRRER